VYCFINQIINNMKKLVLLLILMFCLAGIEAVQAQSQMFTNSGVFLVPVGVDSITIEMVGAGGSGGSNGGGGGGGGGYAVGKFPATPGNSHDVTIGAGGSGTPTSISGYAIMAGAGANGNWVSNPGIGGGGAPGAGSGGTINRVGGLGGGGYWTYFGGGGGGAAGSVSDGGIGGNTIAWTGICITPGGAAGIGGGNPGGDGGKGAGFTDVSCNVTDPAYMGAFYGGGGGGGNGNGGQPGTGAGGYCLISWELGTGIQNTDLTTSFSVLTNPFTDRIIILNAADNDTFVLMNAAGQLIWTGTHIGDVDFSYLSKGSYFLNISRAGQSWTLSLVK
jgi:hypothetical protein